MITTHKIPYRDGEIRVGWASWDDGSLTKRSIKYAYKDASGKISRGSPELPFDVLIDLFNYAFEQKETPAWSIRTSDFRVETASDTELLEERKKLNTALMRLQGIIMDVPNVNFKAQYDQIGEMKERVSKELENRKSGR
ncbi:hypothetical protein [Pseudomonas sp. PB3P13]